jgi:hypothetical protein
VLTYQLGRYPELHAHERIVIARGIAERRVVARLGDSVEIEHAIAATDDDQDPNPARSHSRRSCAEIDAKWDRHEPHPLIMLRARGVHPSGLVERVALRIVAEHGTPPDARGYNRVLTTVGHRLVEVLAMRRVRVR